jgi:hypothetical protein
VNIIYRKEARFSDLELKIISKALNDFGDKLKDSSILIA